LHNPLPHGARKEVPSFPNKGLDNLDGLAVARAAIKRLMARAKGRRVKPSRNNKRRG